MGILRGEQRRVSWVAWARGVPVAAASDGLVLRELAVLADEYGVAIVTVEHLVEATGVHRASVFRALRRLEDAGVLTRTPTRVNGRQGPTRLQLREAPRSQLAELLTGEPLLNLGGPADVASTIVEASDNEGFRSLLLDAELEGWAGRSAAIVARSMAAAAPRQFWDAIARVRDFGGFHLSHDDAIGEVVGIAFEECRRQCEKLIASNRPWALLTTIVTRQVTTAKKAEVDAVSPFEMPESGTRPGEGVQDDEVFVSVDTLPVQFHRLIDELARAGMSPTLARAGTRRIAELAISDASRRHTLAARDPRLADFGITPDAAREWMTLLAGSRTGARRGVIDISDDDLEAGANRIVRLQHAS